MPLPRFTRSLHFRLSALFLLLMVCVILVADLFVADENRIVTYGLTQGTLIACAILTYLTATGEPVYT
ncbi:MAG: NADH:ubiquinone oxidoreductase subunit N, partial [Candidatus Omnitrophota bacterium]